MASILKTSVMRICDHFGHPASLLDVIKHHPEIRVKLNQPACIDFQSVPRWDLLEYIIRSTLSGWKHVGGRYQSFRIDIPEYRRIVKKEIIPNWSCDIADIQGFANSKSDLSKFKTTDEMVEMDSPEMIDEISLEKLAQNLAHQEIRIIHNPDSGDYFAKFRWDPRLFLMNSGGSHHFAAAKYIATRLCKAVRLHGSLHLYSLNVAAIRSLHHKFEIFAVSDEDENINALFDALMAFRTNWISHVMPYPYEGSVAILLSRDEPRSMRVAQEFRNAGFLDFDAYLSELVARQ